MSFILREYILHLLNNLPRFIRSKPPQYISFYESNVQTLATQQSVSH